MGWIEVLIYTVLLIPQGLVECWPKSPHCAGYECHPESSGVWNLRGKKKRNLGFIVMGAINEILSKEVSQVWGERDVRNTDSNLGVRKDLLKKGTREL